MWRVVLALLCCCAAGSLAGANEPVGEGPVDQELWYAGDYGELHVLEEYQDRSTRSGHLSMGAFGRFLDGYFDWKDRLHEDTGFNYIIEISPQFQWALGNNPADTANNETNLIAQWAMIDKADFRRGGMMAWYQLANTLGSTTTTQFQREIGVILPVNGGDTHPEDSSARLMLFAWEQWFRDKSIRFDIGKLTTRVLFDLNRYTVSDREDHFTPMIVNNTVVPYTARIALGAFAQFLRPDWYVSGMIRDADGTSNGLQFNTLGSGKWEYAAELAWTPENLFGLGQGMYRIIPYYTDSIGEGAAKQPAGWTWSLSFDQDIGETMGMAFRYAYADQPFRSLQQRMAFSLQFLQPLAFENDRLGIGVFWGEPADRDLCAETGAEVFWKLQVSPSIEITPGLQVIFNPAHDPSQNMVWIGELRMRLVL